MKEIIMVTLVKSTFPGSDRQYAVSGVRVSCGPITWGDNEIRLQLAGTALELDINVDYSTAQSIQGAIDEANGVKGPVNVDYSVAQSNKGPVDAPFDINDVSAKDLIVELYSRFNE
jgi:hypothetical protein